MEACPAPDDIPALFRSRIVSLRGFDAPGMMRAATVVPGTELEGAIVAMLGDAAVDYIHLHYAAPGCYAARVDRC